MGVPLGVSASPSPLVIRTPVLWDQGPPSDPILPESHLLRHKPQTDSYSEVLGFELHDIQFGGTQLSLWQGPLLSQWVWDGTAYPSPSSLLSVFLGKIGVQAPFVGIREHGRKRALQGWGGGISSWEERYPGFLNAL